VPSCSPSGVWLGVPLKNYNEIIGVMAVQSYDDPNLYEKKDIEVLVSVADQVAIAVERKRIEEALRESESKYRLLFENMVNGFAFHEIVLNKQGKPIDYIFLEVNSAFEQLTGLKKNNIVGKK